jgi:lantibiotic modifying enzyme
VNIDEIERTAREGADSVYAYVERTAEPVDSRPDQPNRPDRPDQQNAQYRWRTLTYENEPQYSADPGNGVGGIVLFLADYHRLTGVQRAIELAHGGARWCLAPEQLPEDDSLTHGRSGLGMALLRLAAAGDDSAAASAADLAKPMLARDPGPVTTLYAGAAGEGLFLLRLFEHTRDERYLNGALARAAWLDRVATRTGPDSGDTYWIYQTDDEPWYGTGFGPGSAGIGYFLAHLYAATHDERWAKLTRGVAATLVRRSQQDHGGLNWAQQVNDDHLQRVQVCDGSPGVGRFFLAAHRALGDADLLATAMAAAETTYAHGDVRGNASQCHGLAGNAELFIELYRLTREARWRERAHDFATQALRYRTRGPEGDTWQADEPGFTSPELLYGAGGTGHFFLRLWRPDDVPISLF